MTKRITDPDEIAALNAILLTGLEAYLKENDQSPFLLTISSVA
jgi:hypothetical protein